MSKFSHIQSDFSGGEFSPFMHGQVGIDRYRKAVKTMINYIPTVQGGATRRAGTKFIHHTKDDGAAILQEFEYSTTQAYMIEFGDQYVRFYKNNALLTKATQAITGITKANPAVVTYSGADTYANGDRVLITGVIGMTQVNHREFTVANVNTGANTFELSGINSTAFDTYSSGGVVGEIYEIVSPYTAAKIVNLKFVQNNDTLYMVDGSKLPRKLIRHSELDWEFLALNLLDGPYFSRVSTQTNLTPGAATGNGITLTVGPDRVITGAASSGAANLIRITSAANGFADGDSIYISGVVGTTEANGTWTIIKITDDTFDLRGSTFTNAYVSDGDAFPAVFAATDVGRSIRIRQTTTWGWGIIMTYTSPKEVTIDIKSTLTSTAAKTVWRLGLYSDTTGYPTAITFHEDRLMFGGASGSPQRQDGSNSGVYEDFKPTELDGQVTAANAIGFTFNAVDVNAVHWMCSDEKGLLSGTVSGEWITSPSVNSEGLTPTNITAKKSTSWGSENVQPVQAGKAALFVQRAGRKVRELNYYFDIGGFRATDLTQLAEHIAPTGIKQMTWQREPQSIVWAVMNNGTLAAMTYDREPDRLSVGWHKHVIGGVSDAASSQAFVECARTLISADARRQDVWLIVKRYVNGGVVRHIEYITKIFEDIDEQRAAFFVDAGMTYDAPVAITAITKANPCVVTASGHGLSNGDKIIITNVYGMSQVNEVTYLVAGVSGASFNLQSLSAVDINSTAYTTYVSGGYVRKLVSTVSGLNHLEGETVSILADGAVQPNAVVTKGIVTLSQRAATVQIGYGYNSDLELLRIEGGARDGTALGKTRRTHRVGVLLHRSLGLKIGYGFSALNVVTFRTGSDLMTRAPALFSGIISENVESDYDFNNNFCIRQDQPLPSTVLAVMPQMVTQDRD